MDTRGVVDPRLAPRTSLARSRRWKRRGRALLYLALALTVGVFGWRAVSLWRLPDTPEPFDLARSGRLDVADADNAMVAYGEVLSRFGDLDARGYSVASDRAWDVTDWSATDPEIRRWADDHREALGAWLPANDRPDSLLAQPEEMRMGTRLEPAQSLRQYARLALLEGSRLEPSGDLAGAWRMYRATLRASRHAGRHGGAIQRIIGSSILRQARPRIAAWIQRPGMTPDLLRRAIGDVEACRAMTSPVSEMVHAEYFSTRAAVKEPDEWGRLSDSGPYSTTDWTNQFRSVRWMRRFLRREPERSARVLRLMTAGYLAQCDRPRPLRPRLLFTDSMIYDHDPRAPRDVRAIAPESLESWRRDSILSELQPFNNFLQAHLDAEPSTFSELAREMAERAFAIEHGRPPKTYGELLGRYLKQLPDGIEPQDPVDPGSG